MNLIQTNVGAVSPEQLVDELKYLSFAAQRDEGMSAEAFGRLLKMDATEFEARYQRELELAQVEKAFGEAA